MPIHDWQGETSMAVFGAAALLVADDVGNRVWRVGPAAQAAPEN